jgi:hypothetical protein
MTDLDRKRTELIEKFEDEKFSDLKAKCQKAQTEKKFTAEFADGILKEIAERESSIPTADLSPELKKIESEELNKPIPADIVERIKAELAACKTAAEIEKVKKNNECFSKAPNFKEIFKIK